MNRTNRLRRRRVEHRTQHLYRQLLIVMARANVAHISLEGLRTGHELLSDYIV